MSTFPPPVVEVVDDPSCSPSRPLIAAPHIKRTGRDDACAGREPCTGREQLFVEMAIACQERDPKRRKTLVCLMDGEAALWNMQVDWLPRAVGILDLFLRAGAVVAGGPRVSSRREPRRRTVCRGPPAAAAEGKSGPGDWPAQTAATNMGYAGSQRRISCRPSSATTKTTAGTCATTNTWRPVTPSAAAWPKALADTW